MTFGQAQAIITSPLFSAFLEPAADRRALITTWLAAQGIPYRTVTLQHKTHIVITYRQSAYNSRLKMKTLIAHYDRAAGTQGANDNSAACIQLLLFAQMLLQKQDAHNIRIIFTDGEEAGIEGIKSQGAYRLGQGLRALSMQQDDIFVFDMCGSGDTLILSESGIYGRDTRKTAGLTALHRRCRIYADAACRGRWLSLPTAYSDNAGLISAGLTAQVITILPKKEAELLMRSLPRSQALQRYIITNAHVPHGSPFAAVIPQTWQRMHTPHDSIETLTPQAFILVDKMLRYLAVVKEAVG